jgi:hypothetical protein
MNPDPQPCLGTVPKRYVLCQYGISTVTPVRSTHQIAEIKEKWRPVVWHDTWFLDLKATLMKTEERRKEVGLLTLKETPQGRHGADIQNCYKKKHGEQ